MVIRDPQPGEPAGWLCIPQSQHAAISGQIARAWGNDLFPAPEPRTEVCLAAERHDDGMRSFDADPELDPETGLPRSFMRMPLDVWLECWERGPAAVAEEEPYAGMLVSLHGEHLLGYRRIDEDDEEARRRVEAWRHAQQGLRERVAEEVGSDPRLAASLERATVGYARKLVEIWDAMSLAVCMPRLPDRFEEVPCGTQTRAIEMRPLAQGPPIVEVDPWPFAASEVPLAAAGRRLAGGYEERSELAEALARSEPETLAVTLKAPIDDGGAGSEA